MDDGRADEDGTQPATKKRNHEGRLATTPQNEQGRERAQGPAAALGGGGGGPGRGETTKKKTKWKGKNVKKKKGGNQQREHKLGKH